MGILLVIAAVLFVLWLLGFTVFHVTSFLIHVLLIAAVIAAIAWVVRTATSRTRTV